MKVVLAGAGGFLGTALIGLLHDQGHDLVRMVRRTPASVDEVSWVPAERTLDPAVLAGANVVVNLAGVGVGDRRWTAAYKRSIQRSRVDATSTLAHAIADGIANGGPKVLVNASAIGFYGDRGDEVLSEGSPPGDGFFPDVCRAWEGATQAAEEAGARVVHLRTGLVLGPRGGLLGRMAPLFKAGVGGRLGSGKQWMSWIALPDELSAIRYVMDHDVAGPVNLTAPHAVRNSEFTRVLGSVLGRPAILPVPAAGLKIALGEFANDVLSSALVRPDVLVDSGFKFAYPDLESTLRWATER